MSEKAEVVAVSGLVDVLVANGVVATKKSANEIITELFSTIGREAQAGKKVRIHGFGTFHVAHKPARKGRNPANGAEIDIPAKDVLVFKATKHAG